MNYTHLIYKNKNFYLIELKFSKKCLYISCQQIKCIMKRKCIITIIISLFVSCANCQAYKMSNAGKEHIKRHESCQLVAYWDSNGYSIGYGHHTKDVKKGMKISKAKAEHFFKKDIKDVEDSANRMIESLPYKYKFSQSFFDGLCDLIYNCGTSGVYNSEFYNRLKRCRPNKHMQKDLEYTLASIKNMRITCKGHIERRKNTYNMMRS